MSEMKIKLKEFVRLKSTHSSFLINLTLHASSLNAYSTHELFDTVKRGFEIL